MLVCFSLVAFNKNMILLSADTNTLTLLLFIYFDESATWGERWGGVEGVSRSVVLEQKCFLMQMKSYKIAQP